MGKPTQCVWAFPGFNACERNYIPERSFCISSPYPGTAMWKKKYTAMPPSAPPSPPRPIKTCEQSLFCSKIRGEESKPSECATVTASVTCEGRGAKPRVARASRRFAGSQVRRSRSHAHVILHSSSQIFEQRRDCNSLS